MDENSEEKLSIASVPQGAKYSSPASAIVDGRRLTLWQKKKKKNEVLGR